MTRHSLLSVAVAGIAALALVLSGCSDSTSADTGTNVPVGEPVSGGQLKAIQPAEPRNLDPAAMSNSWSTQAMLGNALFGTLMINDLETGVMEYTMATDLVTTDQGASFTLAIKPGLEFTDGTPLDAEAVKFNWDRMKDPALGSSNYKTAVMVGSTTVIDSTTVHFNLSTPTAHFAQFIVNSGLNWIASPTALAKGKEGFDAAPVGAGPFVLESWTRQDKLELVRNPDFWDAPRPYLEGITLRSSPDTNQRFNSVSTGAADLVQETNWDTFARADAAGLQTMITPLGGGQYIGMNTRSAPFDDIRARRAVSLALDLESINLATFAGNGEIPETFFPESSPFFTDIAITAHDPVEAQKLFDELAADGKPVSFTFITYPTVDSKAPAESVQAQLSAFKNVEVKVEVVDFPTGLARTSSRDFQMIISGANFQDPDYGLWRPFHSTSDANTTGISDAALDKALDLGRRAEDVAERKAAYKTVQERLVEVVPGIWYTRASAGLVVGGNVHGSAMYGAGSPLPEMLWMS